MNKIEFSSGFIESYKILNRDPNLRWEGKNWKMDRLWSVSILGIGSISFRSWKIPLDNFHQSGLPVFTVRPSSLDHEKIGSNCKLPKGEASHEVQKKPSSPWTSRFEGYGWSARNFQVSRAAGTGLQSKNRLHGLLELRSKGLPSGDWKASDLRSSLTGLHYVLSDSRRISWNASRIPSHILQEKSFGRSKSERFRIRRARDQIL